jgi:hypothetical protein
VRPSRTRGATESSLNRPAANEAYFEGEDRTSEEIASATSIYGSGRWTRTNLTVYLGLPAEIPEIAGRRHLVSGPGEAMKTWLCLAAAVSEIREERGVIWADLDGMGPRDIAARLMALGLTEDELATYVYFTNPDGELDKQATTELLAWASSMRCRLFVADAFTGFLVTHDLDGNIGSDVEKAWQRLDHLCAAGIAVVLIDHVVKNADNRNGQAIGSERKGTAAHLHFDLKPLEKLARGGIGRSRVGVSRDRGAYFPRPYAGEFLVYSDANTGTITWTIRPPETDGETFRPTGLMEKVSRFLEVNADVSKSAIEDGVPGKRDYVRLALDVLVNEGYVTRTQGPHSALIHTSLKSYREALDDVAPSSPQSGAT